MDDHEILHELSCLLERIDYGRNTIMLEYPQILEASEKSGVLPPTLGELLKPYDQLRAMTINKINTLK